MVARRSTRPGSHPDGGVLLVYQSSFDIGLIPGQNVVIRISGGFTYVGKLTEIHATHISLREAAWVAQSGRWASFMTDGRTDDMEVEPYPADVIVRIPRQLAEIADWPHALLCEVI